jgi:hypothetical protein
MAADMLKVTCQPDDVVTPPARLVALAKRLGHYAASRQAGAAGAGRLLCNAERRTESPVRGDRTKTDRLIINPSLYGYMELIKTLQAPQRLLRRPHLKKVIRPSALNSSVATTTLWRLRYEIVASSSDD